MREETRPRGIKPTIKPRPPLNHETHHLSLITREEERKDSEERERVETLNQTERKREKIEKEEREKENILMEKKEKR